VKKLTYHTDSG